MNRHRIIVAFVALLLAAPAYAQNVGDGTINNFGVLTITSTNGVPFAASATTDTTNASNISSGTLGTSILSGSYTGITGIGTLSSALLETGTTAPTLGNGDATVYASATNGGILSGQGSTYDVSLVNQNGTIALSVNAGSTTLTAPGQLNANYLEATGSGTPDLRFHNTAAGTDQKYWDVAQGTNANLVVRSLDDSFGSAAIWMSFNRNTAGSGTGALINTITAAAPVIETGTTAPTLTTGQGGMWASSTGGGVFGGYGSTYDVSLVNNAGSLALGVPTGTSNLTANGSLSGVTSLSMSSTITGVTSVSASGALSTTGTSAPSLSNGTAGVYASSTNGGIITGQGSTNDVMIANSAGTNVLSVGTGSTLITAAGQLNAGALEANGSGTPDVRFHNTAAGTDQKYWDIGDGTNGNLVIRSLTDAFGSAGTWLTFVRNAAGSGTGNLVNYITFGAPVVMNPTTVASLPSCTTSLKGAIQAVTDASSPTYNGTLTGGSSTPAIALCNGSAWTAH